MKEIINETEKKRQEKQRQVFKLSTTQGVWLRSCVVCFIHVSVMAHVAAF